MSLEGAGNRLDSWKPCAANFGRGEPTVRRWEAELGLPVRRMPGATKGRVYALVSELEAWRSAQSSATRDFAGAPAESAETPDGQFAAAARSEALRRKAAQLWLPIAVACVTLAGMTWWSV